MNHKYLLAKVTYWTGIVYFVLSLFGVFQIAEILDEIDFFPSTTGFIIGSVFASFMVTLIFIGMADILEKLHSKDLSSLASEQGNPVYYNEIPDF